MSWVRKRNKERAREIEEKREIDERERESEVMKERDNCEKERKQRRFSHGGSRMRVAV